MKLQKMVALKICNLLLSSQMTRYEFCKKIGMPQQTVKNIIDERNKDIKLTTLALIAEGFGLTLKEFFSDPIFDNIEVE